MGVSEKKIDFFANFHTDFRVICPFRLYKTCQCRINQENVSPVLELIIKIKYRCINWASIQFFMDARGLLLIGRR